METKNKYTKILNNSLMNVMEKLVRYNELNLKLVIGELLIEERHLAHLTQEQLAGNQKMLI